jgi:DNA repair protein RecN (Recombination protein N)
MENKDEILRDLRSKLAAAAEDYLKAARSLSRKRTEASRRLEKLVEAEINDLAMKASFRIAVEESEAEEHWTSSGINQVTYRIATNVGETMRPLEQIASGGELSRVMLALKAALEARDRVDLLFFDEVDSGIGGAVAQAVGERLRRLGAHRQIVCVTHLPMIAALAASHLRVAKQVTGGRTVARIEPVEGDARVAELARMLAGDRVTETTRRQARELLAIR